jgi:hypothetical protein
MLVVLLIWLSIEPSLPKFRKNTESAGIDPDSFCGNIFNFCFGTVFAFSSLRCVATAIVARSLVLIRLKNVWSMGG